MKLNRRFIFGGVALSLLFVNAAFAADLTSRLETYKANNIIPSDFVLESSKTATGDNVVEFDYNSLRWVAKDVSKEKLLEKYKTLLNLTSEDFFNGTFESSFELEEKLDENPLFFFEYLWDILKGNLKPEDVKLSFEEAKEINFMGFLGWAGVDPYPWYLTGTEDFTDVDLYSANLSKTEGLTINQLMAAGDISYTTLPALDFTGADLTELNLWGVDLTRCTGLTANQIFSADRIDNAILPTIDFTGVDLTGKSLYGMDLSRCTGLTGEQLSKLGRLDSIKCTTEQYNSWKSAKTAILSKFPKVVFIVDGKSTMLENEP